ncbi:histidinol-phosphate transaminase [uncultured Oscillibacter sp.]|uniref:pyridoxal phosphate-dependent aminotransferase n=1 Tax=uncultured Oscillibacter sp. TaxID=876091 RepID=UPI0025D4B2B1|nr:aminotransferase class I/II-fold pyridoxal phosphate-dependent enzyme [uncultured Oscillibacter sp.]
MEPIQTHGGDWAGYRAAYGRLPLDFSANLSPLGLPVGVRAALRQAAEEADRYPDPLCRELCAALAEREGVPAEWILCGNGAADLIFRAVLALRPRRALITAPAFGEYAAALRCAGCETVRYALHPAEDFRIRPDILEAITPGTELVILCEPNNPTGVTTPRPLLLRILERCRETGARLLADECFGDFLADPAAHSLRGALAQQPVVVLRAFTKLYAMAGVRLGYVLCADRALLAAMRSAGQPWGVSTLAQAAGTAALREESYVACVRALVSAERPRLSAALAALGLRVVPGEANYLLFQSPRPLGKPLEARGILLRGCGDYEGLDASWYRTAVRTGGENQRLLASLKEVLS